MRVRTQVRTGAATADAAVINWGTTTATGTLPSATRSLIPDEILAAIDSLQATLASSTRGAGLYDSIMRESRPWLKMRSTISVGPAAQDSPAPPSRSFTKFDAFAQTFAQRWIDPLFDQTRERQRRALSETRDLPAASDAERDVNRRLVVSLTALGLALAGDLFFPPLLIPAAVGGTGRGLPAECAGRAGPPTVGGFGAAPGAGRSGAGGLQPSPRHAPAGCGHQCDLGLGAKPG